jgi:hypothetical protein
MFAPVLDGYLDLDFISSFCCDARAVGVVSVGIGVFDAVGLP